MNFRSTYTLFAVVLLLLAALIFRGIRGGAKSGDDGRFAFPSLAGVKLDEKEKTITRVEIERTPPGEPLKIVFTRSGDDWQITEPVQGRADKLIVNGLVRKLLELRREAKYEVVSDAGSVGLEPPTLHVNMSDGTTTWQLALGNVIRSGSTNRIFARSLERPKDILPIEAATFADLFRSDGKSDAAGSLLKPVGEFRAKGLLGEGGMSDSVTRVAVAAPGKEAIVLVKGDGNRWRYEAPAGYGEADSRGDSFSAPAAGEVKPPDGVDGLLRAVLDLRVASADDFVPVDANKDLVKDYGLDPAKPEGLRLEVTRGQSPPEVLLIGKKADDKGDKVYAKLASEPGVVKLTARNVEPLRKLAEKPDALRDRNLLSVSVAGLDAFDIKLLGQPPLEFRKADGAWKLFGEAGPIAVDPEAVKQVLDALTQPKQATGFPSPGQNDNALGFDNPTVLVSLWTDGLVKDERKPEEKKPTDKPKLRDGLPSYQLLFGHLEGGVNVRRIDGKGAKADFKLPETLLKTLKKDRTTAATLRLDFLDKTIPNFNADMVTKLTLVKSGGATTTLEKEAKEGQPTTWKLTGAGPAPRVADPAKAMNLIDRLAKLAAQKLTAEKAGDAELTGWQLKPPGWVVTVASKDDKDAKPRVYHFGEAAGTAYAQLAGQAQVYQVDKSVLDQFAADLRDPVVFKAPPAKVKRLTVTGKPNVVIGAPDATGLVKIVLERVGLNDWKAVSGVNYGAIDGPKVEAFVNAFQEVRTGPTVAPGTVQPAQTQLDVNAGALGIELAVDGEKEPFTLTLGAAEPTGFSLYASSAQYAGETITVPKATFGSLREKPVYFGK